MADYCTRCGRPLPESGVCPCTRRKTRAPRRANPFVTVLRNLPRLWRSYFRDPIATTRRAGERRDWITGVMMLLLVELLSFLSVVVLTLRTAPARFFAAAAQWATAGLVCPLLAMAAMLGVTYALSLMLRMRPDLRTMLAVTGVGSVLPLSALALSTLLTLAYAPLFAAGTVLLLASWLVSFFVMVYQVLTVRLRTSTMLLLIGAMSAVYAVIDLCRDWLLAALA